MAHNIIYLMSKNIDRIDSKYLPEISGSPYLGDYDTKNKYTR